MKLNDDRVLMLDASNPDELELAAQIARALLDDHPNPFKQFIAALDSLPDEVKQWVAIQQMKAMEPFLDCPAIAAATAETLDELSDYGFTLPAA